MKKIKMKTLAAGPDGTMDIGKVYTVEDEEADQLIKGKYAYLVEETEKHEGEKPAKNHKKE